MRTTRRLARLRGFATTSTIPRPALAEKVRFISAPGGVTISYPLTASLRTPPAALEDNAARRNVLFVTSMLGFVSTGFPQSQERPVNWKELPKPFHSDSVRNRPEVVSRPDRAELRLPTGFVVEEYLSGFDRPRFMMLGPGNEILLTDSGSRDARNGVVYALKDSSRTKLLESLDRPYGLALNDGWLYVAETTSVKRYRYDAETMRAKV